MVAEAKPVGPKRFRESYGRYLEDFAVGDVYEHRPGRTITETDNTWFTLLTMNQHPLHFDKEYGANSEFGRVLVNSCLTLSLVTGMSAEAIRHPITAQNRLMEEKMNKSAVLYCMGANCGNTWKRCALPVCHPMMASRPKLVTSTHPAKQPRRSSWLHCLAVSFTAGSEGSICSVGDGSGFAINETQT